MGRVCSACRDQSHGEATTVAAMNSTFGIGVLISVVGLAQTPGAFTGPWEIKTLAEGLQGGEGPAWSRDGYLLLSDTQARKIFKYVPGQPGLSLFRENSGGANGNAFDRKGRLYTCEYVTRRVSRTMVSGTVEVFVERYQGKQFNAPNDIVVRKDGNVYFTDPLFTPLDKRDLDIYGVYRVAPGSAEAELVASPKGRPNGIALSPDGKILYVGNTDEKNIRAYDLSRKGAAANERVLIADLPSGPDGLKTDSKGNLYITARGVRIYSRDGKPLGIIETPGGARNCAFGDKDLKTLYITGRTTLYSVRVPFKGAIQ